MGVTGRSEVNPYLAATCFYLGVRDVSSLYLKEIPLRLVYDLPCIGGDRVGGLMAAWNRNAAAQNPRGMLMANNDISIIEERIHMAKSQSKKTYGNASEWKGFVDATLSDADREEIREKQVDLDQMFMDLVRVLQTGHKISFTKKADKPAIVCTFTGAGEGCKNAGWALSSFAPDLLSSMKVNLYKHFVMADEDYTRLKARSSEDFG